MINSCDMLLLVSVDTTIDSIDTIAAWKKLCFILSFRSEFHMTDRLLIAVHAFVSRVSMSISVDETLLPSFFQAAIGSILLYGCTTWTLTKRLRGILNKSCWQHPTKHQLYGHLPPIRKTVQVRRTRHAGHCWRSRDEIISDVLLWNPSHGRAKVGRQARTCILQLFEDTGCSPGDLPEEMNDKEGWRESVRDIRADGATRWWWWDTTKLFFENTN